MTIGKKICVATLASLLVSGCSILGGGGDDDKKSTATLGRSEEHTSALHSLTSIVCRLLLENTKQKAQVLVARERNT